jgi:multidrug efflux pump subunit AcrA (membrane-fusion protein)
MTVDVKIIAAYKEQALLVPRYLVPAADREARVRVHGPRGPEERLVRLGLRDDENVEVLSGLQPGERLLLKGTRR